MKNCCAVSRRSFDPLAVGAVYIVAQGTRGIGGLNQSVVLVVYIGGAPGGRHVAGIIEGKALRVGSGDNLEPAGTVSILIGVGLAVSRPG